MKTKRLLLSLGSPLLLLACDSQPSDDYEGEGSAVIPGNLLIASQASAPEKAVDVGIVWLTGVVPFPSPSRPPGIDSGNHPYRTSTTVKVAPTLPAQFALTVRELPASDVLQGDGAFGDKGQPYWARGMIAALRAGADPAHLLPDDVLGVSTNAEIIYFTRDSSGPTDPISARASSFNVAPSRGYHVAWHHVDESIAATMRSCAGDDALLDNAQYSHVCWLLHDGARQAPDPWVAAELEERFAQCKALHDPATTLLCDGVLMSGTGPDTATPDVCTHLVRPRDSCYRSVWEYEPPESRPTKPWPESPLVYDGERGPDARVSVVIGSSFFGLYVGGSPLSFPGTTFK